MPGAVTALGDRAVAAWARAWHSARPWVAFALSAAALFALQPASPVRYADFWLPNLTLALTILVWVLVQRAPIGTTAAPSPELGSRENVVTASLIAAGVVLASALRNTSLCCVTPGRPPDTPVVLTAVAGIGFAALLTRRIASSGAHGRLAWGAVFALLAGLAMLKAGPLSVALAAAARSIGGQDPSLASATDLGWLGFSYVAFRLIHVLRDLHAGKRAAMNLREFVTYVAFAPALLAGPIDRAERFLKDLRIPQAMDSEALGFVLWRAAVGAFKKFVLADALALIALSDASAAAARPGPWAWLLVYAYAFRIYLDFSGYTDLAVAAGRAFGIKLPENFNRPYLQPNLTQFWNSWHMSLSQWFRAYWFNPLTRWLRGARWGLTGTLPMPIVVLAGQSTTMLLIGLWHGITPNFLAWGAWHAAGLFAHNRFAEWRRQRAAASERPNQWLTAASTVLTFHYVALGWVWFALGDIGASLRLFQRLAGV